MSDLIANAIHSNFTSPNVPDANMEAANVVDVIAGAGLNIMNALDRLGVNKSTNMGGLELLALETKQSGERMAEAIGDLADAMRDIADAIRSHGKE